MGHPSDLFTVVLTQCGTMQATAALADAERATCLERISGLEARLLAADAFSETQSKVELKAHIDLALSVCVAQDIRQPLIHCMHVAL